MATNKMPWYLLVIPLLWSLIGLSAAVNLHIYEDFGLVIAGVIGTVMIIIKGKRSLKENTGKAEILQSVKNDGSL